MPTTERAVPLARHEPQIHGFSGIFDRTDNRHVSIPCLQHCEGAHPDGRTPIVRRAACRHDAVEANQFDTFNAREGLRDRARVASGAIVFQPAQH